MARVAIFVTHLSGTGHYLRARALARAVAAAGGEALLITGGRALPHLGPAGVAELQLPPVRVEGFDYADMRRPDGLPADAAWMACRERQIRDAVASFAPHVLVTETYPFGRRRLRGEFEAAIAAARQSVPDARIVASIRDVPEPMRKESRRASALARVAEIYDAVMVHGDASVLALSASWPLPEALGPRIHHLGYIAARQMPQAAERTGRILVSVGGGATGRRLLALAAEAAERSSRPWHLLVGGADARAAVRRIMTARRRARLLAEPVRADFPRLLSGADASISLFGYNTALELAACRTPALIVPFEEHGEREQGIRARAFARFPGLTRLRLEDHGPSALARIAERAAAGPRRPMVPLRRDGAARAARFLCNLAEGRS